MTTDAEKAEIKGMIQALYRYANVLPVWDGDVNEDVAKVFGIMLAETQKCSSAFCWIPSPPGGQASIAWLIRQLGRGLFNAYRKRLSFTCARTVIYKWRTALDMAALGIASSKLLSRSSRCA
ncbi:hypothetical protein RugamoR57_54830 [Duganella caerulea]